MKIRILKSLISRNKLVEKWAKKQFIEEIKMAKKHETYKASLEIK